MLPYLGDAYGNSTTLYHLGSEAQQAVDTGADILAVACPYCLQMFEDSVKTMGLDLQVMDVSELLAAAL